MEKLSLLIIKKTTTSNTVLDVWMFAFPSVECSFKNSPRHGSNKKKVSGTEAISYYTIFFYKPILNFTTFPEALLSPYSLHRAETDFFFKVLIFSRSTI